MKSSGLLMSVLGSSILLGGAMFSAPRVTHNAGMWYLAGQVRMALGDTTGGLKLMSRAAKQRQADQNVQAPQAKPAQAQTAKNCGQRSTAKPDTSTPVAKVKQVRNTKPIEKARSIMASIRFPGDPFNGAADVPGLTREQIARVSTEYQREVRRWMSTEKQRQFEIAQLQKMKLVHPKLHGPQPVRVVVTDTPAYFFDETLQTLPSPGVAQ